MYIKDDDANARALRVLERLMDQKPADGTPESKRLKVVANAIYKYESKRYGKDLVEKRIPHAWEAKHPEVTHKKPLHDPRDSNHVRHKLRQFYRDADKMQASAEKAGR